MGFRPQNLFFPWAVRDPPTNTMCQTVYAGCANVTDDRQTDHATEKCVGIGGLTRAIPPKTSLASHSHLKPRASDSQLLHRAQRSLRSRSTQPPTLSGCAAVAATVVSTHSVCPRKAKKVKVSIALFGLETHHRATERHLPYGITQCYLPPDTGERAPLNPSHADRYSIYPPRRDGRLS